MKIIESIYNFFRYFWYCKCPNCGRKAVKHIGSVSLKYGTEMNIYECQSCKKQYV